MAVGYEDGNDAGCLRLESVLRLTFDKGHKAGASQSMPLRLDNEVLGNAVGLEALDAALTRRTDTLLTCYFQHHYHGYSAGRGRLRVKVDTPIPKREGS